MDVSRPGFLRSVRLDRSAIGDLDVGVVDVVPAPAAVVAPPDPLGDGGAQADGPPSPS